MLKQGNSAKELTKRCTESTKNVQKKKNTGTQTTRNTKHKNVGKVKIQLRTRHVTKVHGCISPCDYKSMRNYIQSTYKYKQRCYERQSDVQVCTVTDGDIRICVGNSE